MNALLIFLTGAIIMSFDPAVPQIVKTVTWVIFLIVGVIMGALTQFHL